MVDIKQKKLHKRNLKNVHISIYKLFNTFFCIFSKKDSIFFLECNEIDTEILADDDICYCFLYNFAFSIGHSVLLLRQKIVNFSRFLCQKFLFILININFFKIFQKQIIQRQIVVIETSEIWFGREHCMIGLSWIERYLWGQFNWNNLNGLVATFS